MKPNFSVNSFLSRSPGAALVALSAIVLCATADKSSAAVIWTNPITGTNPNTANPYTTGQTFDANVTVSGIGRGAGAVGTNANDRYNANSWNTASLDATAYFSFTLDANAGYEIDFTDFVYTSQRSNTSIAGFSFRSSLDSFASGIGTPDFNGTTISLTGASYQNLTESVEFRFYAWGAGSSGNTFSINDFTFNGAVSLVAAAAAQTYWDTNGASGDVGGSGTWSSASTSFSTTIAGTDPAARAKADPVNFAGTAGTVTVSGTVEADGGITFDTTGYQITGGTALELGGATNTITTATDVTAMIDTVVTGTGGVNKTGAGTLIYTGDQTYTGGTTITTGTLQLGNGGTGGTLAGNIVNNGNLAFNHSGSFAFGGDISGTGTLAQIGGTTILTGSNTYSGVTTISTGTLQLGNGGTAGTLGSGAVTNNAALAFNRSDTITVANAISGTGTLDQAGAGTTILTASNSYGTTTISSGTLQIGSGGTVGTLGSGAVTNNSALSFNRSNSMTVANAISGTGTVSQIGGGTTILTGLNSYGTTTISAGTLQIGDGGTAGTLGAGAVTNNATLSFKRSDAVAVSNAIGGTGVVAQSGTGSTTLGVSNSYSGGSTVSSGSLIAGVTGALGSGTVAVTGGSLLANAGVTVANGIIVNAVSSSAFTATYNFTAGDTVAITTGSGFTASDLSRGNWNGAIPADAINALPSSSSASGTGSGTFNAPVAAVGSSLNTATSAYFQFTLDATTASSITLSDLAFLSRSTSTGPLAYSLRSDLDGYASNITSGTLVADSNYASKSNTGLSQTGDVVTFRLYGSEGKAATVVAPTTASANWRIDDLVLTGTTFNESVATLGSSITSGTALFSGGVTLESGVQLTSASGGTAEFSGVIIDGSNGAKGIEKVGDGKVILSGDSTYTGTTTVSAGTLVINGDQTAATGNVSVSGTLAGTAGTVGGNTSINAGGHLAAGNGTAGSIGSETFNKNLTFVGTSIFDWDLSASTSDTGTSNQGSYDKIVANGGAGTLTGTSVFTIALAGNSFTDAFWNTNKTWSDIFSGNALPTDLGAIFTTFGGSNVASDGAVAGQGSFAFNGSTTLSWTAVPEPTTALAGLLLGAGLLRRRR